MRKIVIYLIGLFVLCGCCLIACKPTAEEREQARIERKEVANPIVWDTIKIEKAVPIILEDIKATFFVKINYIVPVRYEKQEIVDSLLNDLNEAVFGDDAFLNLVSDTAVNKYLDDFIEDYTADTEENYSFWRKILNNKDSSYSKTIETQLMYNEANLVSYQVRLRESDGYVIYRNLVFDLVDGTIIGESDLFREGYEEELNKCIIEQLLRDNSVETIEELNEKGYWGAADIASNNNFYLNSEGITYTYNPDEYADSELGMLKVFINYEDLVYAGVLKKESPASILYQQIREEE